MGWNTYYGVGGVFDESTIKEVANSLISTGLRDAGYKIVWLDFGWATGARDRHGNLVVSSTQWPDGMSGLTAWLHANGFQAGIYTDAGPSGCSGQGVGSYGHYQKDANQFAAWGFDAVKMDFCGAGEEWLDQPPNDPRTLYAEFSNALANNSSGRPMILNVCNFWGPGAIPGTNGTVPSFADSSWDTFSWAPADAQSWRTDTDIGFGANPPNPGNIQFQWVLRNLAHDTGTSSDASQPGIQTAAGPPGSPTSSPIAWGHWNDPDYLGPGLGMTDTQAQSQFSMWAMVAAPLILGSDPRSLTSASINMLENKRVIAIDQDSLGVQGYLLSGQGTTAQVWVKPLANGDRAVALLNTGSSSQQITTSASAVGMPSANQYTLLDVWANQTSTTTGNISATVPADAVVLYRVTPANTPAPIVTTSSSSSVSSTSATVSGTVNPQGQPTTYHFDYGTDTSYGSTSPASPPNPSAGSGTTAQPESANLTGLTAGVTYHYRIEATSASGTSYGPDQTFTTTGGPVGPPSGPTTAPQGSWVGTYGGSGYDLAAWDGGNDVVSMPGVSVSLAHGSRYLWASNTTDVRALESADQSTRNLGTYYDSNQVQVQLSFSSSYSGNLELYAVDLDKCGGGRQETITVGNQTANLTSDFSQGAWVTFPITGANTLTVTVNHIAGCNAVLSGIFLN
jgi:alpha-galactosidase